MASRTLGEYCRLLGAAFGLVGCGVAFVAVDAGLSAAWPVVGGAFVAMSACYTGGYAFDGMGRRALAMGTVAVGWVGVWTGVATAVSALVWTGLAVVAIAGTYHVALGVRDDPLARVLSE